MHDVTPHTTLRPNAMESAYLMCREHLALLMPALDQMEKRNVADAEAAASSATLWDDVCHLAAGMPDIPPALRDRMPAGAAHGVATSRARPMPVCE